MTNLLALIFTPYEITKKRKLPESKALLEELSIRLCPLGREYDPDIHDSIACLRILDGSLPEHPRYGSAVNFFAPAWETKYWIRESTPAFGFFFYYTLDMAICP